MITQDMVKRFRRNLKINEKIELSTSYFDGRKITKQRSLWTIKRKYEHFFLAERKLRSGYVIRACVQYAWYMIEGGNVLVW